jgi:hypothetical protein
LNPDKGNSKNTETALFSMKMLKIILGNLETRIGDNQLYSEISEAISRIEALLSTPNFNIWGDVNADLIKSELSTIKPIATDFMLNHYRSINPHLAKDKINLDDYLAGKIAPPKMDEVVHFFVVFSLIADPWYSFFRLLYKHIAIYYK